MSETYRIVVCVDIDADDLTDAYRQLFKGMAGLCGITGFDWESSDEWYAEDGQRIEEDALTAVRMQVFKEDNGRLGGFTDLRGT